MSERASGRVGRSAAATTTERWLPMPLWSGRVETENLQTVPNAVVTNVCANFYDRAP